MTLWPDTVLIRGYPYPPGYVRADLPGKDGLLASSGWAQELPDIGFTSVGRGRPVSMQSVDIYTAIFSVDS